MLTPLGVHSSGLVRGRSRPASFLSSHQNIGRRAHAVRMSPLTLDLPLHSLLDAGSVGDGTPGDIPRPDESHDPPSRKVSSVSTALRTYCFGVNNVAYNYDPSSPLDGPARSMPACLLCLISPVLLLPLRPARPPSSVSVLRPCELCVCCCPCS